MDAKFDISVVVFAFNEEAGLGSTVREVVLLLRSLPGEHEIVIVDDGSTDGTASAAAVLEGEFEWVRVVTHPRNWGLGAAYRTGFSQARKDVVTFWPADGQFDPKIIARFVQAIGEQNVDLVLGHLPNWKRGAVGALLSRGERMLYWLLGLHMPRFQGILMFRRTLLDGMTLVSEGRGWAVLMEFILRATRSGCRVCSLPTDLRPRVHGMSRVVNLRTIASNVTQLIALRRRMTDGR